MPCLLNDQMRGRVGLHLQVQPHLLKLGAFGCFLAPRLRRGERLSLQELGSTSPRVLQDERARFN